MEKILLISIKPEFAEKIVNGSKTLELRKKLPRVAEDDLVIIYSSSPVMSVIGTGRINRIITDSPKNLWSTYSNEMGIDRKRYFEYYEGKNIAVGIFLKDIQKSRSTIPLTTLRNKLLNFSPPQSFRYFEESDIKRLKAYF